MFIHTLLIFPPYVVKVGIVSSNIRKKGPAIFFLCVYVWYSFISLSPMSSETISNGLFRHLKPSEEEDFLDSMESLQEVMVIVRMVIVCVCGLWLSRSKLDDFFWIFGPWIRVLGDKDTWSSGLEIDWTLCTWHVHIQIHIYTYI